MAELPDHNTAHAAARPDVGRGERRSERLVPSDEGAERLHSQRPLRAEHTAPELRDATGLHVAPRDGRWAVCVRDTDLVAGIAPTKAEAMQLARRLALDRRLPIIEHGRDGQIQRTFVPRV